MRREQEQESSGEEEPSEDRNLGIELLALGKRVGFSMAEINELRCQDLVDFVDALVGKDEEKPRMATQADIDAFYN